jgi:phage-related protein
MNEALNGTTDSADKVAEALAKLSPNARAFVLAMRDLGPAWKDLKLSVQDAMFADLDSVFTNLANATLPTLKTGMTDVGGAINGAAKEFAAFWESAEAQEGLRAAFAGTSTLITSLQPGLAQLTTGFLDIGRAAEPVMANVGKGLGDLIGGIGQAFSDAFADGSLTALISTFGDILSGLGGGLNSLLDGFIEIGNYVGPTIGPLFQSIGDLIKNIAPAMGVLGAAFSVSLQSMMPALTEFINALAVGLTPIMPVLADLFSALGNALTPLIPSLSEILQTLGGALIEALVALTPAMGPLAEAFSSLVTALAPFLPMAAEVISTLVQALAPALTKIFDALGPVIQLWLDGMRPAMEQLAPILADVAMQLGTAIADALVQIMPLLPTLIDSFSRIILALAPFIPQLVQISVDLLPVLIDLFMVLVETVLPPITAAIEFLAEYVLPLVIEGLRAFAQEWSDRLTGVKNEVQGARDFISGATESITGFFTSMGDKISSVWGAVVATIRGAVGEIGKFLTSLPSIKIPDLPGVPGRGTTIGFKDVGTAMVNWAAAGTPQQQRSGGSLRKVPGRAQGGVFKGAGGPTDDANLIRISNREHLAYVTRAQAVSGTTLPLLDAINNGWVPPAGFLHDMVPGFANGGLVTPDQLNRFATQLEGKEYEWGGVNWGDCSGAMSALANYTAGNDPFGSRFATGNMAESLAAMGAIPGLGPSGSFNLGWFNGGPYGGHTAGTLPNGVNVEMGGARGDGQYGGGAAGADDPEFTDHAHFPPEFFLGGDPTSMSGATTGTGARKGGIKGTVKGGGAASGGTAKGGGGSGGGGGGGSAGAAVPEGDAAVDAGDDIGYGATDVFVTNWPSDFPVPGGDELATTASDAAAYTVTDPATETTAAVPMGAVPGATSRMGGFDPTYYGDTAPYGGIAGANEWASRQDFQSQFNSWGIDALKEIGGELFSPLGLESAWGSLVDRGASELSRMGAPPSSQAGEYQQVVFNNSFVGMDPNKVSAELERQFQPGTAVAGRYRGN